MQIINSYKLKTATRSMSNIIFGFCFLCVCSHVYSQVHLRVLRLLLFLLDSSPSLLTALRRAESLDSLAEALFVQQAQPPPPPPQLQSQAGPHHDHVCCYPITLRKGLHTRITRAPQAHSFACGRLSYIHTMQTYKKIIR